MRTKKGRSQHVMGEIYTETFNEESSIGTDSNLRGEAEKPRNAWFQFRTDPLVKERYHRRPGPLQESQIVKDMALEWKQLTDAEKLPYEQKASRAIYDHNQRRQRQQKVKRRKVSLGRTASGTTHDIPRAIHSDNQASIDDSFMTFQMMQPASSQALYNHEFVLSHELLEYRPCFSYTSEHNPCNSSDSGPTYVEGCFANRLCSPGYNSYSVGIEYAWAMQQAVCQL